MNNIPTIKNKKIFITGGRGFIGTNLCLELSKHNEITVLDNNLRDAMTFFDVDKNIKVVKGNILDYNSLKDSVKGHDTIIHLAAIAGVSSYHYHPFSTMEVNFLGTYNVLKAAKENKNTEFLLNFSTSEVFGPHAINVSEKDNTSQGPIGEFRWTYSVSKLAAEHACFSFSKEYGLNVSSVRPFNIYGPGQVGEGAIQSMISNALQDKDIIITGDGLQTRSWCYISDMITAVKLILSNKQAVNNVFNIGNPSTKITINDLAKKIIELTNSKSKIVYQKHIGADVIHRNLSLEKAKTILGFEPKVGLDEGILKSAEWYKKVNVK